MKTVTLSVHFDMKTMFWPLFLTEITVKTKNQAHNYLKMTECKNLPAALDSLQGMPCSPALNLLIPPEKSMYTLWIKIDET